MAETTDAQAPVTITLTFVNNRLQIATPAGNIILLDDTGKTIEIKDQNNNTIVMNPAGISLNSKNDLNINAGGTISINATGAINIKSTLDTTVDGLNVNLAAQGGFAAKGSATAELSATGQTTITGAMVMIN